VFQCLYFYIIDTTYNTITFILTINALKLCLLPNQSSNEEFLNKVAVLVVVVQEEKKTEDPTRKHICLICEYIMIFCTCLYLYVNCEYTVKTGNDRV